MFLRTVSFFIIGIVFLGPLSSKVSARPPTDIQLEYDFSAKTLKIKMHHVSRDIDNHFIRRIVVFRNGAEVLAENYRRQQAPSEARADISVEANGGDVLAIKAYCSEGGTGEASLTVIADEAEDMAETPGNKEVESPLIPKEKSKSMYK